MAHVLTWKRIILTPVYCRISWLTMVWCGWGRSQVRVQKMRAVRRNSGDLVGNTYTSLSDHVTHTLTRYFFSHIIYHFW